jgi:hypothetical protein
VETHQKKELTLGGIVGVVVVGVVVK